MGLNLKNVHYLYMYGSYPATNVSSQCIGIAYDNGQSPDIFWPMLVFIQDLLNLLYIIHWQVSIIIKGKEMSEKF